MKVYGFHQLKYVLKYMKGSEKLSFRSVKRTVLEPTPETSVTSQVFSAILNAYYVPDYKSIILDLVVE